MIEFREPPARVKYDTPTVTEKLISWYYVILVGGVGIAYLAGGPGRFRGPSLLIAREILPWYGWGILFIIIALGIALTIKSMLQWIYIGAGAFFLAFYAVLYTASAVQDPRASFVAAWVFGALSVGALLSSFRRRKLSIERELAAFDSYGRMD